MLFMQGLVSSTKGYVCVMDGDLQDPPEMVKDFSEKINQGFDSCLWKKKKKEVQSLFKKFVIKFFIISLK